MKKLYIIYNKNVNIILNRLGRDVQLDDLTPA